MYLAQAEADLPKMIMDDKQFGHHNKMTDFWKCKLARSCGIVIDFVITGIGFNPVY